MSLYDLFETDEVAETEGFELEVFDGDTVIKFMLARAGGSNKKFVSRLQARMKPIQRKLDAGTIKEEVLEDIMVRTIAETLILSWDGVTDRDGNEIPFSVENAVTLLRELPALREMILEEAQKISNFQAAEREENSGNSETTSAGPLNGESGPQL